MTRWDICSESEQQQKKKRTNETYSRGGIIEFRKDWSSSDREIYTKLIIQFIFLRCLTICLSKNYNELVFGVFRQFVYLHHIWRRAFLEEMTLAQLCSKNIYNCARKKKENKNNVPTWIEFYNSIMIRGKSITVFCFSADICFRV